MCNPKTLSNLATIVELVPSIIISGGIVAGLFEWIRNWSAQRREEYLDISEIKIETLSKSAVIYEDMAKWNEHFSIQLVQDKIDYELAFYYLCNLLLVIDKWHDEIGQWQFDNIHAEIRFECFLF